MSLNLLFRHMGSKKMGTFTFSSFPMFCLQGTFHKKKNFYFLPRWQVLIILPSSAAQEIPNQTN